MDKVNKITFLIVQRILLVLWASLSVNDVICSQNIVPKSSDLKETGINQRRDLSLPGSRIVLNFFHFNSRLSAAQYSNRPTIPLNVAYLTTQGNKDGVPRFCRAVPDLLMLLKNTGPFESALADSSKALARSFSTEWMPHALPYTASYADGSEIKGVDYLYDEKTIVRKISFEGENGKYYLAGKLHTYTGKNGTVHVENSAIIVNDNNINYAVSINSPIGNVKFSNDTWFIPFDATLLPGKKLIISIAFADKNESNEQLLQRVRTPIRKNDVDVALNNREKFWDTFLQKLPHPLNFNLTSIDAKGVTPEKLKETYYKAWVFTAQNMLPEDPEEFPYPQICAGKASLWDEGEVRAPFSASWESLFGIQFYAFIDSQVAWKAFKGMMSLVDQDGMLGGESLPSRKAQTAMILYQLTGDRESLKEIYPALKRYMDWRIKITHWVFKKNPPDENRKDANFAFSALVDMEHLHDIAQILKLRKDANEWNTKRETLLKNCLQWFWETPTSLPEENYHITTGKRSWGGTLWISPGLYVKGLKGDYLNGLLTRYTREYKPDNGFAGYAMPKYPDISYTIYGLIKLGQLEKALGLLEVTLRDIVRSDAVFAEQYIGHTLQPDGVRPSLFGSSSIIDFCLLMNGYKYDRGIPSGVILKEAAGGVNNLLIKGKTLNISTNDKTGTMNAWGSYLRGPKSYRVRRAEIIEIKE